MRLAEDMANSYIPSIEFRPNELGLAANSAPD
jgi:hypothetical protein